MTAANLLTIRIRHVAARIRICAIKVIVTRMSMMIVMFVVCRWSNDTFIVGRIESMAWPLIFDLIEKIGKVLHRHKTKKLNTNPMQKSTGIKLHL